MKDKKMFVVTCPENGWDCVFKALYLADSIKEVEQLLNREHGEGYVQDSLVIHELYRVEQL